MRRSSAAGVSPRADACSTSPPKYVISGRSRWTGWRGCRGCLIWVQRELALWHSEEVPPPAVAWELHTAQSWARLAYCEQHTAVETKQYELTVTDGAPLTLCIGTDISVDIRQWRRVPSLLGRAGVTTLAPGCRRVIPDVPDSERHFWRCWCDDCAPNTGQTRRKWTAEIKRRTYAWERDLRAMQRLPN